MSHIVLDETTMNNGNLKVYAIDDRWGLGNTYYKAIYKDMLGSTILDVLLTNDDILQILCAYATSKECCYDWGVYYSLSTVELSNGYYMELKYHDTFEYGGLYNIFQKDPDFLMYPDDEEVRMYCNMAIYGTENRTPCAVIDIDAWVMEELYYDTFKEDIY